MERTTVHAPAITSPVGSSLVALVAAQLGPNYLARYTHPVATSNHRLVTFENGTRGESQPAKCWTENPTQIFVSI